METVEGLKLIAASQYNSDLIFAGFVAELIFKSEKNASQADKTKRPDSSSETKAL